MRARTSVGMFVVSSQHRSSNSSMMLAGPSPITPPLPVRHQPMQITSFRSKPKASRTLDLAVAHVTGPAYRTFSFHEKQAAYRNAPCPFRICYRIREFDVIARPPNEPLLCSLSRD